MARPRYVFAILVLGTLVDCSSGGPSSATGIPTFTTTLPATASLSQLTSAQVTTLCNQLNGYRGRLVKDASFKPVACQFAGIRAGMSAGPSPTDADVQAECSAAAAACTSAPPAPYTLSCSVGPSNDCAATVAQYTACLNDSVAAAVDAIASLPSCGSLTVAAFMAADGWAIGSPAAPPSCAAFASACPTSVGDVPPPLIFPGSFAPTP